MSDSDFSNDEQETCVINYGSSLIRAGFAGNDQPHVKFPCCVGTRKYQAMFGMGCKDAYVGDEAFAKKGVLKLNYPIQNGIVQNWDDMVSYHL